VAFALARSLLLSDAVTPEALAHALFLSATRGVSLVRALLTTHAVDAARLDEELEHGEAPVMHHVAAVPSLMQNFPPRLCERLLALPVRRDARTGTVDVAVVDARDLHAVEEMAYWLGAPVRMVRTSLASMDAALGRVDAKPEHGVRSLAPPIWAPPQTPSYGVRAVEPDSRPPPRPSTDPNIPIPLTRKSITPVEIIELGRPAVERDRSDAVLELRRRKSVSPSPEPWRSAITSRGPFAPNAPSPPFPDVRPVLDKLRGANDRDTVLELVLEGVRTIARRVAILAVKRDALVGWTCSPEFADRASFRALRLPTKPTNVLTDVLGEDGARLVKLPKDATHAPLFGAMKIAPAGECALAAIRVEAKPVAVVLAAELGDTFVATRRIEELSQTAGDSLARLLRERRK